MIRNASIALLIAANMVPVIGVLFWDWDVFSIIFLFWCENVVIGLFGIARTMVAASVLLGGFFTVHYGGFMFGHLMVIFGLFGDVVVDGKVVGDEMEIFLAQFDTMTIIAIVGLFISHGWSYMDNYLGKQEHTSLSGGEAMSLAYKRMVITHIALLAGGFLLTQWNEPLLGLLLLVGMKIAMDIYFHRREHDSLATNL